MDIKTRGVDNVTILDIKGCVDINSSEIIEVVGSLLGAGKKNILCNFKSVNIVDYCGLSILAIAYKNVLNHKGHMKFEYVSSPIIKLFEMVGLDRIFKVYQSEKMAVSSFKGKISDIEARPLRRRFERLPFILKAMFRKGLAGKVPTGRTRPYAGRVLNISGEGIFIRTERMFPVETRIDLEILLEKKGPPLSIKGKVIWTADKDIQPRHYPGMGIKFVHISRHNQEELLNFIDKNVTRRST